MKSIESTGVLNDGDSAMPITCMNVAMFYELTDSPTSPPCLQIPRLKPPMWCTDFAKIYWAISSSLMWKKPMLRDSLWSFCVLADSCKQNALLTSCYFSTIYFYFSKLCRLSAKEKEGNKSDRNWLPRRRRRRWAAMCLPFRGWGSCLVFFRRSLFCSAQQVFSFTRSFHSNRRRRLERLTKK